MSAIVPSTIPSYTIVADSAETTGLKWSAPVSGSFTKITSGSFTGVTGVNLDSLFSSTYRNYQLVLYDLSSTTTGAVNLLLQFRYSGTTETGANYYGSCWEIARDNTTATAGTSGGTSMVLMKNAGDTARSFCYVNFSQVGNSSQSAVFRSNYYTGLLQSAGLSAGLVAMDRTYTGIRLSCTNNIEGKYIIYGLEN